MIDGDDLVTVLRSRGFSTFCGVPCSYFSDVYRAIELVPGSRNIVSPNEGSAYATAAGFAVAGRRCVVFLQNSGLGNLINPLTSLTLPYGIGVLSFVSLRGWPTASMEEPQHLVMGQSTTALLDALGVNHYTLAPSGSRAETMAALESVLVAADGVLADRRPVFVLVPRGAISTSREPAKAAPSPGLDRRAALSALTAALPGALFVTTTGYTSRDLFAVADRRENLYLQGAMGHAVSVALGVALAQPDRQVVAVDGDGSAIMHLGAMSAVGAYRPPNLLHVVLDNGCYESTGGQPTTAPNTYFAEIARGCGYETAVTVHELGRLTGFLRTRPRGPVLLHARIMVTPDQPGARATSAVGPREMVTRFSEAIGASGGRTIS